MFTSFKMATPLHVKAKTSWKTIDIPQNLANSEAFSSLVDIQVLTEYDLVADNSVIEDDLKERKKNKKKKRKLTEDVPEQTETNVAEETIASTPRKKRKKKSADKTDGNSSPAEDQVSEDDNLPTQTQNNKKKNKKASKLAQSDSLKKGKLVAGEEVLSVNDNDSPSQERQSNDVTPESNQGVDKKKKRKKKRKKKKNMPSEERAEEAGIEADTDTGENEPVETEESSENHETIDMSQWSNLCVPDILLKALEDQGFGQPTVIQKMVLPSAIRDRKDILGAAETGSGKTLAFGIPVLARILNECEMKEKQQSQTVDEEESDGEKDEEEDEGMSTEENQEDEEEEEDEENMSEEEDEKEEEDEEVDDDNNESKGELKPSAISKQKSLFDHPLALVLEPTRELAMQVKKHLTAVAAHTDIKFAAVVGGMSIEKQRRVLSKRPHVIIATPGRLWQLIEEGNEFLADICRVFCLVVDEADRMVEKGHFEELFKLMELLNKSEKHRKSRQTFVMSATLTMDVAMPKRLFNKTKKKAKPEDKLKTLTERICLGLKPKVIDLTPKDKVAQTLTELRVNCKADEKDMYLYYFLCEHPGRSLVFVNSKDCLRRLVSVFTLLQCQPLPLHADMHQKQRLKNLDRFTENSKSLLLASDVAARGLDIPKVDHVIHYQVPRTMENYIHRSGRTARASNLGLSVMMVCPEESRDYRKIVQGVRNGEDLPILPVEGDLIPAARQRVQLAQTLDVKEHRVKKKKAQNNFFTRAAEEMDMIIDDPYLLQDLGDEDHKSQEKHELKQLKVELNNLLRGKSLAPLRMTKYPTKSGQMVRKKVVNLHQAS